MKSNHVLGPSSEIAKKRALSCLEQVKRCLEEMDKAAENGDSNLRAKYKKLCESSLLMADAYIKDVLTIEEWSEKIHQNAKDHGWYDKRRSFGDVVALMHSELSEALEEYRAKRGAYYLVGGKPEGVDVELLDCVIRILDTLSHRRARIEEILRKKHNYNVDRPYRHGGKAL